MTEQDPQMAEGRPPTEEEMRAAYEAELKRIRVEDVIFQTIVSLVNLGGRRVGIPEERDLDQVRLAIEGARALLPLVESQLGPDGKTVRDAIAQLQMGYAQFAGRPAPGADAPEGAAPADQAEPRTPEGAEPPAPEPPPPAPGEPGPAQRSGRLWVPGQ